MIIIDSLLKLESFVSEEVQENPSGSPAIPSGQRHVTQRLHCDNNIPGGAARRRGLTPRGKARRPFKRHGRLHESHAS